MKMNRSVAVWNEFVFVLASDDADARRIVRKTRSHRNGGGATDVQVVDASESVSITSSSSSSSSSSTSPPKRQKSQPTRTKNGTINVLTYNVTHNIETIEVCHQDKCIFNVCTFIDKNARDCDFIGIQEYSDLTTMTRYSSKLKSMGHSHTAYENQKNLYTYGPITFYSRDNHKLDAECNEMKFGFGNGALGRCAQVNFFDGSLCVINVHAGHDGVGSQNPNNIHTFQDSLMQHLNGKFCDKSCRATFIQKLQTYHIIMLGDMNDDLKGQQGFHFTVDGVARNLRGRTTEPTCCGDDSTKSKMDGRNNEKQKLPYDHILSTFSEPPTIKVYKGLALHSDHHPVKSTLLL